MAARATFALKAGLCVRRARLAIVTPDMRHSRRSQADFPLIGLSEFAQPPLSWVEGKSRRSPQNTASGSWAAFRLPIGKCSASCPQQPSGRHDPAFNISAIHHFHLLPAAAIDVI